MKLCALASGSKGNATIVKNDSSAILVDDGLTLSLLKERLDLRDMTLGDIKAILVTHEHIDHIKGVATLASKIGVPVYASEYCIDSIVKKSGGKNIDIRPINEAGDEVAGFDIEPFRVPHDAIYTLGYTISDGKSKVGITTDLGTVTDNIFDHLSTCDSVMIEANHDRDMLLHGTYPYALKKRIDSVNGHLSNEESARTIFRLYQKGVTRFLLAHLSEDNNSPEIAFDSVASAFDKNRLIQGYDYTLDVALFRNATKILSTK